MNPDLAPIGHRWRTFFHTWTVVKDERRPVYFDRPPAFGCSASIKIAEGQKLSLQTQCKLGGQTGFKLGVPGVAEISSTVSSEISETLAYELSASFEWSYTSRPCEFCAPQVHFPDARVTVLTRSSLHIPLFSARKTIFLPGETYEIRANCRHAPEKCANCKDAVPPPGSGPILMMIEPRGPAHLERVTFADRDSSQRDLKELLKEILSAPDDKTIPEQFYLVDLAGTIQSASRPGSLLYSVDDIDRTLGAVRLHRMNTRLLLLRKRAVQSPSFKVELTREGDTETPVVNGEVKRQANEAGFHLIEVEISNLTQLMDAQGNWKPLRLHVDDGETVQEWPAVMLDQIGK